MPWLNALIFNNMVFYIFWLQCVVISANFGITQLSKVATVGTSDSRVRFPCRMRHPRPALGCHRTVFAVGWPNPHWLSDRQGRTPMQTRLTSYRQLQKHQLSSASFFKLIICFNEFLSYLHISHNLSCNRAGLCQCGKFQGSQTSSDNSHQSWGRFHTLKGMLNESLTMFKEAHGMFTSFSKHCYVKLKIPAFMRHHTHQTSWAQPVFARKALV